MLDFTKKLNDSVLPPGWMGHGYLDTFANLATGKAAILYQANAMVHKWKEWQDMQYRYFDTGQAKPTLIAEWDELKLPFGLEILGSGIVPDMVTDAVRGMPSALIDWGLIMAVGMMITIPVLIFFVFIQRYLIAGWGDGGVK